MSLALEPLCEEKVSLVWRREQEEGAASGVNFT